MAKSKRDMFLKSIKQDSNKHKGKVEELLLNNIIADENIQSRIGINEEIVNDYSLSMLAGDMFPEIIIFRNEKGINYIADGFHRYKAAQIAGLKKINCEIKFGEIRDAILHSIGANSTHGLRRTNEDKRKAVLILLNDTEWNKLSARKISELAGVSKATVGTIKNELGIDTSNIIGADGREYKIKTTGQIDQSKNSRKKFYRFKMELEYKDEMKEIVKNSKLNESALLKEAFEYLQKKYK